MKVLIDGKEYNLSPDSNGLVKITFTKQTKDAIEIGELEDCSGTTLIDEIQIEHGEQSTPYEDPNLILGNATGLISEIRGLEYAISDPKTGLSSQITMLAQGFEQEVNDAIGNYSVQGQTVDGLFAEISKVNGNVNRIIQNADGTSQLISNLNDDYQSLKSTANLYERIIGSTGDEINQNVSRIIQTSDVIQTEVAKMDLATNTALTSKITQLANNINLKVSSGDLLSQINVQAGNVLIESGTNKLNITPETTYIQDATIKSAMIESVVADKIATGTFDASKAKIINLDAESITSNQAKLIQAGFTSSSGGTLALNGDQILSTASDGSQTTIGSGRVNFRNTEGKGLGSMGYEDYGNSPYLTLRTSWGSHFRITARQEVSAGNVIDKHVLTVTAGKEMYLNTDNTYVTGDMTMQKAVKIGGHLTLSGGEVNQLSRVRFANGAYLEEQTDGNTQLKSAGTELQFYVARGRVMYSEGTRLMLDLPINMQGNGIFEQSDERIKTDIKTLDMDSLNIIQNVDYKSFTIINNDRKTFGFIAQQMQELAPNIIHEQDGLLTFDSMEYTHLIGHALQQHVIKTNYEVAQLKAQVASLQDELATLKGA